MWKVLHRFASPQYCYDLASKLWAKITFVAVITIICAMCGGLLWVPADYQQGDGFRIIYIHAPSAFMGMGIYVSMAVAALISLVWRIKVAAMWMSVSARIGVWFTLLALLTGSIWGKPMWGTWWVWDARLTSTLILFFLYLGFIALQSAIQDKGTRDKAGALLVLVGVINIPVIHYSVVWWNTLHQPATISQLQAPAIASSMLLPLLLMIVGFGLFYLGTALSRLRAEILWREQHTAWIKTRVMKHE